MCGIAGIFTYKEAGPPVDREELLRLRESMRSRGPDGEGLWLAGDRRVGLAHRRLSIIDLSPLGSQPMSDSEQSLWVVFNGEIYNYRELRRKLEARGCRFRSHSDTEVLLHLYQEYGQEMVQWLRGMYAFAIWDSKKRGVFLARDPFGIKPLYFSDNGVTLRFASQVKALLKGGAIDTTPEPAGHAGFFLFGFVPEPYTLFKGARSLPAGSTLWTDVRGSAGVKKFCDISRELAQAGDAPANRCLDPEEAKVCLWGALSDTVQHHLVADVPVGVFLSAGLDSSALTAAASCFSRDLHSFTLGCRQFQGTGNDETVLASRVAARYHTNHQTKWITKEDFQADLPRLLEAMDQPSIDGVNAYFVAKEAAATGIKVVLSGLGGDELCGGYPSFRDIPRMVKALAPARRFPKLAAGVTRILAPLIGSFTSPKYAGLLEYGHSYGGAYLLRRGLFMPWELELVMDRDLAREGWRELRIPASLEETVSGLHADNLRVAALEMTWYMRGQLLRDADWAGMAHSLEIRVPLVDLKLLRDLAPWLHRYPPLTKMEVIASLPEPLPREVVNRPKSGFLVPVNEWLKQMWEPPGRQSGRGLRGWAQRIYQHFSGDCRKTASGGRLPGPA